MRLATTWLVVTVAVAACSEPVALQWKLELGAASVSTPLVTDAFIAVGHELGVSIAQLDGSLHCTFDAHGEVISGPKTDGKRVFFGSTNYVFYAIDTACREVWKYPARDRIKSDPFVDAAGGRVFTSSYDGHIYALAADSGRRLWVFPGGPTRPAIAAAPEPGKKRRKKKADPELPREPPQPTEVGDFSYSSPMLVDGVLYAGNRDNHIYAIDAATGLMLWRHATRGSVTSTPLVDNGMIYIGSNDGNLYAIDADTPWRPPFSTGDPPPGGDRAVVWKMTTQDWINSSARLDNGILYIGGNDRHIYAVEAATGQEKWSVDTKGPAIAIPAIYKNLVFAAGGSGDGAIYGLQIADGSLFWKYVTGGKVESDPIIAGDRLYVSSTDRSLYAFKIARTVVED